MAAPPLSPRGAPVSTTGAFHTVTDSERKAYVEYINSCLLSDEVLAGVVPVDVDSGTAIYDAVKDGVLLARLINHRFPTQIDQSRIVVKPRNVFEMNNNHDAVLRAAKELGCSIVNIGPTDLVDGKEHLVMGVTWQLIKVAKNKGLQALAQADESVSDLPPEQILLRWFNYHLQRAGHTRVVTNFTTDIQDAENYAVLLGQLSANKVPPEDVQHALSEPDVEQRAELVLELADRLGCRKFVTPTDIVEAHPRLNLAFVANLFNEYPGLVAADEDALRSKATDLGLRLDELMKEYEELRMRHEMTELELARSRSDFEDLSEQMRQLGLQLAEAYAEKADLARERDELLSRVAELEERNRELIEKLQESESERIDAILRLGLERDELARLLAEERENNAANASAIGEAELAALREQYAAELRARDEALMRLRRDWETDRARLLEHIRQLEEENARLRAQLAQEAHEKAELAERLRAKEEELDRTVNESDEHKLILLQRIRQLEEEMAEMANKHKLALEQAERDKEEELRKQADKFKAAMEDAESKRNREGDKIRLLLTVNIKQGWLLKQSPSMLKGWQMRFFVLKDHILAWYRDEKEAASSKPRGVVSTEEMRLYELDEKEVKKKNAFQIIVESQSVKLTLAAQKEEEMKDWMAELRLDKKKKLGVDAAGRETQEERYRMSRMPSSGVLKK